MTIDSSGGGILFLHFHNGSTFEAYHWAKLITGILIGYVYVSQTFGERFTIT